MTEYTPTAEEIRSLVESFLEMLNVSPYEGLGDTILWQFDCWLEEHNMQVAEAERERIIALLEAGRKDNPLKGGIARAIELIKGEEQ